MSGNTPSSSRWLRVTSTLKIPLDDLRFDACLNSGPGGQSVNRTESAVQLTFDLCSAHLPENIRHRLRHQARGSVTQAGTLIIRACRYRSQKNNRQDAIDRLLLLIRKAAIPPKPRHATKPSRTSIENRLAEKKKRSMKKKERNAISPDI